MQAIVQHIRSKPGGFPSWLAVVTVVTCFQAYLLIKSWGDDVPFKEIGSLLLWQIFSLIIIGLMVQVYGWKNHLEVLGIELSVENKSVYLNIPFDPFLKFSIWITRILFFIGLCNLILMISLKLP